MTKNYFLRICSFLLLCMTNLCMTSVKADVVEISSAGTLSTLLSETATEVTIKGPINGTDVKYLRHLINDKSLTSMDMTEARIVAGGEAYYNDYKATEDDVIGEYMFHECANLKVLRLPNSITRIKDKAFTFAGISEIDIPNNIKSIGWDGFASCPSLTKAVIGRGITSLGQGVFWNSPLTDAFVKTTGAPSIAAYQFTSNPAIHVYSEVLDKFQASDWAQYGTLVGDLETYYPDEKDPALEQGTLLKEIFADEACTTLNAAYQSMSDSDLSAKLKAAGFDDEFANIVLKVKNNSWATYENDFRIQDYKPYSDAAYWRDRLKAHGGSFMGNPTGIYTQAGQKLYVFVDSDIPADAKLSIVGCVGKEVVGLDVAVEGFKLSKGMNIIEGISDALYYIVYSVDTRSMSKAVSDWPDMKIHIEGGVVNGYYDATHHNDAEYQAMLSNATHERFIVKGETSLFIFRTETFRNAWPSTIDASIQWFEDLTMWERELTGICETVAGGSRSGAPFYLSGGESIYPRYYNNPACAIEGDPSDLGWANATWFRTSYNSYECVSQSFDVNRRDFDEWCAAHEVGHTNQGAINLEGCGEVSNNLFSNIASFHCGKNVSRGLHIADEMNDYAENIPFAERDIWSMTRMYYQLYLYYHQAQKNTSFYPELFTELRNDPLVLGGNATQSLLKFVRIVCKVANEDLTDFFRAWGFFIPTTSSVTVTQAEIDATLSEISKYPRKNREILFIEDRIERLPTTGYLPSVTERKDSYDGGTIGECGDLGQFTDYIGSSKQSASYIYNLEGEYVNLVGEGGVGFAVYDQDDKLLAFANTFRFRLPDNVRSQTYKIYAIGSDGSRHEATTAAEGGTAEQNEQLLKEAIAAADAFSTDEQDRYVGYYQYADASALAKLVAQAKTALANHTDSEYITLMEGINDELSKVSTWKKVQLMTDQAYNIWHPQSQKYLYFKEKDKVLDLEASLQDKPTELFKFIAQGDKYLITNEGTTGAVIMGEANGGIQFTTNDAEKLTFNIIERGLGLYAIQGTAKTGSDFFAVWFESLLCWWGDSGELSDFQFIKVDAPKEPENIPVTGISLSQSTATMTEGETLTLTATVAPDNATEKGLTWTSSNEKVATVDATGKVTAVAEGSATITATAKDGSGISASCAITVNPNVAIDTISNDQLKETIYQLDGTIGTSAGQSILIIRQQNGKTKKVLKK